MGNGPKKCKLKRFAFVINSVVAEPIEPLLSRFTCNERDLLKKAGNISNFDLLIHINETRKCRTKF